MQIDLAAFANYAQDTFDYSADFEEDAFSVRFEGVPVYIERKQNCFNVHVGTVLHQLPR